MRRIGPLRRVREQEQGYILVGVVIMLAVFMILMSVAVPKMREDIRRDQEVETIQRGQQYIRALRLFYRRFHRYPTSVDELEQTNGLRFLRRRYEDPLTRSDDWQPVLLGLNKAPLTMGFFGEVLNAGTALPGHSGDPARNSVLGTPPPTAFDSFSSGAAGGSQASSPVTSLGGPVIGVRPSKSMASIIVYKTKANYEEWEFVYDPAADPMVPKWDTGGTYTGAPGFPPPTP